MSITVPAATCESDNADASRCPSVPPPPLTDHDGLNDDDNVQPSAPLLSSALACPPAFNEPAPPARIARVSRLPKHLQPQWLDTVTAILKGYHCASREERTTIVLTLLKAPEALLAVDGKPRNRRRMPTLTPEQILAAPPADPVPKKDLSPEQRLLTRAVAHCAEGKLSRAVKTLLQETHEPLEKDTLVTRLQALHPPRGDNVDINTLPNSNKTELPKSNTLGTVRKMCDGKAAGPSGWTEELVKESMSASNSHDWHCLLEDLVYSTLGEAAWRLLRRATLRGIPKGGLGIRPIAVGETLLKVAFKILLDANPHVKGKEAVGADQYAFVPAGTECIIHQVRAFVPIRYKRYSFCTLLVVPAGPQNPTRTRYTSTK